MNNIQWIFLFYALTATASIMGIGIAIAEKSIGWAILCVIALVFIMGIGFITKKKMREIGKLT